MDTESIPGYVRLAMQLGKTTRSLLALTIAGIALATACGDGDDNGMDIKDDGVTGGTSTGGTSGTAAGGTSGTSGSATGGNAGESGATTGGTGGAMTGGGAGAATGGTAGGGEAGMGGETGGEGGEAGGGEGGMAGGGMAGGGMAGGGMAGMSGGGMAGGGVGGIAGGGMAGMSGGGMAGGGMGGVAPTMLYDFESGVQGWVAATTGATVSQSMTQAKDGSNSLACAHPELNGTDVQVQVDNPLPPLWPGTVVTVNVYLPVGLDTTGGTFFQMFTNFNNFSNYDNTGNGQRTAQSGAWTTWTYTVPNTFPGGIQRLGFQLGDNAGGTTIPAGSIYIDSITATGGRADCTAVTPPTGLHDFETTPLPADTYNVSGGGNVTVAQSTDRAFGTGTGSLKVSFAGLPAGTTAAPTKRFIYINKPNLYCGQTTTFHVWLPTGSEAMGFQVLAVFNWFSGFSGTGPVTVTRDDWTTGALTIPMTVDHRGFQQVGIEFSYTGATAYTGDAYIDQVTW